MKHAKHNGERDKGKGGKQASKQASGNGKHTGKHY